VLWNLTRSVVPSGDDAPRQALEDRGIGILDARKAFGLVETPRAISYRRM
jgi:hypothetical protein